MEYFCCYHSYKIKLAKLSDQEVGRLFRALLEYSETGETQELTGRESIAFDFIAYDIDLAKKNEKNNPTQKEERNKLILDFLASPDMGDNLKESVKNWIRYKKERGELPAPTETKQLFEQIKKYSVQYSEDSVSDIISESISRGFKGIIFDALFKRQNQNNGDSNVQSNRYIDPYAEEYSATIL